MWDAMSVEHQHTYHARVDDRGVVQGWYYDRPLTIITARWLTKGEEWGQAAYIDGHVGPGSYEYVRAVELLGESFDAR